MDHNDEQEMEMEALESILGEDGLRKYTGPTPSGWSSERDIHAIKLSQEEVADIACSCDLLFQHTEKYPEDPPLVKLSNTRGLSNTDVDKLTAVLQDTATEHIGMASVFAIMQAAQEWLDQKVGVEEEEDPAVVKKRREAEEEKRIAEARAHGTPVTPESFAAWKAKFEEEEQAARIAAGEVVETDTSAVKKTGKQFFLDKYGTTADRVAAGGEELDLDDEDGTDYELEAEDEDDEDLDEEDEDDEAFLDQYLAEQDDA